MTRLRWKLISVYLEIVLIMTKDRCTVCVSYVTWVMWNLVLVYLEAVLASVQDRCTVCAKHSITIEIVFNEPDGTPR